MNKRSFEWWIGAALVIYLGVAVAGAFGGTVGAVVAYSMFVLIDIREYLKVCAHRKAQGE